MRNSHDVATSAELAAAAGDLFDALASGARRPAAAQALPLAQAAAAHRLLEGRNTSGTRLIIP